MSRDKEPTQRRVYVLPSELVERIVDYQNETNLPSEVEAVRRLLDDALRSRDTYQSLARRIFAKMKEIKIAREVAKDVVAGHPLVKSMEFDSNMVNFQLRNGFSIRIFDEGSVDVFDENDRAVEWADGGE